MINIGFWKSESEPDLPSPIITKLPYIDKFSNKCEQWVQYLKEQKLDVMINDDSYISYCGYSWCRICNIDNGNEEFIYKGYKFPSGLFHYILVHHIDIPIDFQGMIVDNSVINFDDLRRIGPLENMLLIYQGSMGTKYSL